MQKKTYFDILMGVGEKYYADPSFFLEEVLRLGISKRLPDFPEYYHPRRSKLWLVHWKTRRIFMFTTNLVYRCYTRACYEKMRKKYGDDAVIHAPPGTLDGDFGRGCGNIAGVEDAKYVRQPPEDK